MGLTLRLQRPPRGRRLPEGGERRSYLGSFGPALSPVPPAAAEGPFGVFPPVRAPCIAAESVPGRDEPLLGLQSSTAAAAATSLAASLFRLLSFFLSLLQLVPSSLPLLCCCFLPFLWVLLRMRQASSFRSGPAGWRPLATGTPGLYGRTRSLGERKPGLVTCSVSLYLKTRKKSNNNPIKCNSPGEARTHNPGIARRTVYKYRALTDCATGDGCHLGRFWRTQAGTPRRLKSFGLYCWF